MSSHDYVSVNNRMRLIAAGIIVAFTLGAYGVYSGRAQYKERRTAVCVQIENLKKGFREDAIKNYNDLPRTVKVLNIRLTPELRRVAKENRDAKLKRYAAKDC